MQISESDERLAAQEEHIMQLRARHATLSAMVRACDASD